MSKLNSYQVICKGADCKLYSKCGDRCILKSKFKNKLKGCNYAKKGDCNYCSHKNKCIMIKPYSKKLYDIEVKRNLLENENKKLRGYVNTWIEIEDNLKDYCVESVTDVVYFKRNKKKMIDKIKDNEKLIKAYLDKEKSLIEKLS